LETFNRSETQDYLHIQIQLAGGDDDALFPDDVCQTVFKATGGVPRLINQLCDHALLAAYVAGRRRLDSAQVEEAWAELQQLPTPWNGANRQEQGGVIEFGRLDDMPGEPASSAPAESAAFPSLHVPHDHDFESGENDAVQSSREIDRIQSMLSDAEEDFQPAGTILPEVELILPDSDYPFKETYEQEEVIRQRYEHSTSTVGQHAAAFSTAAPSAALPLGGGQESIAQGGGSLDAAEPSRPSPSPAVAVAIVDNGGNPPGDEPRPISPVRRREFSRLFAKLRQA
jgi:hypothetical protein